MLTKSGENINRFHDAKENMKKIPEMVMIFVLMSLCILPVAALEISEGTGNYSRGRQRIFVTCSNCWKLHSHSRGTVERS